MKISLIIPCINEEQNLRKLLPHLLASLPKEQGEILVADGGSSDGTKALCAELGVQYILSPEKGRAAQMNYAAKKSVGETLYFIHADTLPPSKFFIDIQEALKADFPIGSYRFRFDSKRFLLKINSYFTRFDRIMCRGGDQSLYVSRNLFIDLGGFKNEYVIMEEYEFIIRAKKVASFRIMDGDTIVSARKYDENSYLRVNIANFSVFMLFFMGVKPKRLLRIYKSLLNHPTYT